jgi:hypothetical protein
MLQGRDRCKCVIFFAVQQDQGRSKSKSGSGSGSGSKKGIVVETRAHWIDFDSDTDFDEQDPFV